jgi:hypothetical protein
MVFAAAILASPMGAVPGGAQDAGLPLPNCFDAVGTYLTSNHTGDDTSLFISRSLLSITNDGHAFFTDSAEGGGPGYGPFTGGRGAWRCLSGESGETRFKAIILDFTFAAASNPNQQIGRLDIEGTVDTSTGKLTGRMDLSFAPLEGDPMNPADLKAAGWAGIDGDKITVKSAPD